MITGTNQEFDIRDIGFTLTEKFTLLGFEINRNLDSLNNTHKTTVRKMIGIANHWQRFNLSLPGRITIAKLFLYSQIGYSCSILMPSKEEIKNFKNHKQFYQPQNTISQREAYHAGAIRRTWHP